MIFDFSSNKDNNATIHAANRFAWYPNGKQGEFQRERERRIANEWGAENLDPKVWARCRGLLERFHQPSRAEFLREVCRWDAAPLIDLLYPRNPGLFLNSLAYTIPNQLFVDQVQVPISTEVLQHVADSRSGHLNAACLFALSGAVSCLEALLEQGADPNGLDRPESWNYLVLKTDLIIPVTPLDCAVLTGQNDCQLVLELFGGQTLHECLAE